MKFWLRLEVPHPLPSPIVARSIYTTAVIYFLYVGWRTPTHHSCTITFRCLTLKGASHDLSIGHGILNRTFYVLVIPIFSSTPNDPNLPMEGFFTLLIFASYLEIVCTLSFSPKWSIETCAQDQEHHEQTQIILSLFFTCISLGYASNII